MRFPDVDLVHALSSRDGQIKTAATLLLAFYVRQWRHPWIAAFVLAAVLTWLDISDHLRPVSILVRWLVFLVLAGSLYWALDRARNFSLFLALALAGAAVFLFVV